MALIWAIVDIQATLMEETSPLAEYYPCKFKEDLNGAKSLWKAVALLPFIDRGRLRREFERVKEHLSADERARNRFGTACFRTR